MSRQAALLSHVVGSVAHALHNTHTHLSAHNAVSGLHTKGRGGEEQGQSCFLSSYLPSCLLAGVRLVGASQNIEHPAVMIHDDTWRFLTIRVACKALTEMGSPYTEATEMTWAADSSAQ